MAVDLGTLGYKIEIDTSTGEASLSRITGKTKEFDKAIGGQGMLATLRDFSVVGTVAWRAIGTIVDYLGQAVDASVRMQNALIGLNSVATAFGQDATAAKQAAVDLAQDGLMSVSDAAAGLKNLLARGFSLPEAITLMNKFKDSAAFNRQASLDFGRAIVNATEGLKNENSILVDNAGVTKNVSVMWKEYADQLGVGAMSLTTAQKRQAELNGITKEAAAFQGDAAKMAGTYSGQMSALSTAWEMLIAKQGDFITLSSTVIGTIKAITNVIKDYTWYLNILNNEEATRGKQRRLDEIKEQEKYLENAKKILANENIQGQARRNALLWYGSATEKLKLLNEQTSNFTTYSQQLGPALNDGLTKPLESAADRAKRLADKLEAAKKKLEELTESLKNLGRLKKFGMDQGANLPSLYVMAGIKKAGEMQPSGGVGQTQTPIENFMQLSGSPAGMQGTAMSMAGNAIGAAIGIPMAGAFIGEVLNLVFEGTLITTISDMVFKILGTPDRINTMIVQLFNVFIPAFSAALPQMMVSLSMILPTLIPAIVLMIPQLALAFIQSMANLMSVTFWREMWLVSWRQLEETAVANIQQSWSKLEKTLFPRWQDAFVRLGGHFATAVMRHWIDQADELAKKISDNLGVGGGGNGHFIGGTAEAVYEEVYHGIFGGEKSK